MAIAFDNAGSITPSAAGTLGTIASYVTTGSNISLFVSVAIDDSAGSAVHGIGYNGTSLTKIVRSAVNSSKAIELWYLPNISGVTANIVGTLNAVPSSSWAMGAISYTGVAPNTPIDGSMTGTILGTTVRGTITANSANEWITGGLIYGASTGTAIANNTIRWSLAESAFSHSSGLDVGPIASGGGKGTIGENSTSTNKNIVAASFFPAISLGSVLQDDFNNGVTINAQWTKAGATPARITQGTGQLVITSGTDATYNDLQSAAVYDLTTSSFFVNYAGTIDPSLVNVEQILFAAKQTAGAEDDNNKIYWTLNGGVAAPAYFVAGVQHVLASFNWTGGTTWLRIGGTNTGGGSVLWDTSPDGTVWTNFNQVAAPFNLASMYGAIQVGAFGTQATTTAGTFDNFGTTVAPVSGNVISSYKTLLGAGQA